MGRFRLDLDTHDLVIEGARFAVAGAVEAVAQDVKSRLLSIRGEYVLDRFYGFPYGELNTGALSDVDNLEAEVKDAILTTPGVEALTSFYLLIDKSSRRFAITFSATTTAGDLNSEVTLNASVI